MSAPTITTDRLILRAIVMADWEPYAAMWADPRVTTFIGGKPRPRDLAWTKFAQSAGLWSLLGYGVWAVVARDSETFLGVAGFAQFERGIAELGGFPENGWAFAADSWGRGIASEAIAATVGWADAHFTIETRCMIDDDNVASAKVATRNGYVPYAEFIDTSGLRRVFRRPAPSAPDRG